MEFRLRTGAPGTKFVVRFVWAFVWIGEAATVLLLAIGTVDLFTAILGGSFLLFTGATTQWSQARYGEGTVYLDNQGLTVRTRGGTHYYKWEDVAAVQIRPFAGEGLFDRLLTRVVGEDAHLPAVHLKLRRSLRFSLVRARFGTDIAGIPSLILKTTGFFLEDPEGFVRAANTFLRQPEGR